MFVRTALAYPRGTKVCVSLVLLFVVACGGRASVDAETNDRTQSGADASSLHDSGPEAAGDAGGPDAAGDADKCSVFDREYKALLTTDSYRSCNSSADCTLVFGDICYLINQQALNAAGATEAERQRGEYSRSGCRIGYCGSGGGPTLKAACEERRCVTRGSQ
jgi:hypothetical protein